MHINTINIPKMLQYYIQFTVFGQSCNAFVDIEYTFTNLVYNLNVYACR